MQEDRQTTEVRETNEQIGDTNVQRQSVAKKTEVSGVVIAQRVVYYIGGLIIALVFVRLLLQLLGANQGSDFVGFMYGLSGIFVAPFYGIFVYGLLTVGIAKLLTISRPQDEV